MREFDKELRMFDAIIIGSGISGATLSRELCKYKLNIVVLEKGNDVCWGASRGNSATIHSGHDAKYGTKKALYNVLGNKMYPKLCKDLSVPYNQNGMIVYATSPKEMTEIEQLKENADNNGVKNTRICNRDELLKIEKYFGPKVVGGLYAPTSGMVCPYKLVIAICENSALNGVEFFLNTEVEDIEVAEYGYLLKTNKQDFKSRYVFNCAGVHADEINNMVSNSKFRIFPRKGEHLIMDNKLAPYVRTTISQTPISLSGGGHSKGMGIMPSIDGTVILGCDAHDVTNKDDTTTNQGTGEIIEFFEQHWKDLPISKIYENFPKGMIISSFAGIRPHPECNDFILGQPEDSKGFFNMAGIESPGLTAAPAIAVDIAKQVAKIYSFKKNRKFNRKLKKNLPFRKMTRLKREKAIKRDNNYSEIVCRCESVTKAEILQAIHSRIGARTVNAIKMRTRAGMGRCQGGFCESSIIRILSDELNIPMTKVNKRGEGSEILMRETCAMENDESN